MLIVLAHNGRHFESEFAFCLKLAKKAHQYHHSAWFKDTNYTFNNALYSIQ